MTVRKSLSILIIISIFLGTLASLTEISGDFQQSTEDIDNWSKSVTTVNFSKDDHLKFNFAIADEASDYVLIMYLTFHTILNLPLEVVSYLDHNKNEQTADFGIQVSSNQGNFSLGLNGTIIIDTPFTDPIFIEITEGEQITIADFTSFLGENITIPINFIPFKFPIDIVDVFGIQGLNLILTPTAVLHGSSSIQARIMSQNIVITDPQSVYTDTFPVSEDFTSFSTEMRDIYLDIDNVSLAINSLTAAIVLETNLGNLTQDFTIDLSTIDTSIVGDPIGELLLLYVSSTFYLGDLTLTVLLNSAPYSFISLLIALVAFSGFAFLKKRKKV